MQRDEGVVLSDASAHPRMERPGVPLWPLALIALSGCLGGTDKGDAGPSPEIKRLGYGCSVQGREDDASYGLFEFRMSTVGMAEDTGSAFAVIHFVGDAGEESYAAELEREWDSPDTDWARWGTAYVSFPPISCCDQDRPREDWPVHFELWSDLGALLDCAYSDFAEDLLPSEVLSACRKVEFFDFRGVEDGAYVGGSTWWESNGGDEACD